MNESRSRFLPMLAPIAATALAAVGVVLGWPMPMVLGAVVASAAAWITHALWSTHPAEASPEQQKLLAEQQEVLAELREFITREVGGAHNELNRSRTLIREAVGQLNGSFRSMEEQSRQQRDMITNLVEKDGAGSPGVKKFADAAGALMGTLTQVLADDSRESVRTVQTIDEMVQRLDEVFDLLNDLKAMAEQAGKLAADAGKQSSANGDARKALALLADEVRNLAEHSTSFNDRVRSLVNNSKAVVGRVRIRVEEAAERGMNTSIEAKTRSDGLIEQAATISRSLAAGIRMVAECGSQIREDVATAVRSLQFEDITAQALSAANVHLGRLEAINKDATRLQQVLTEAHGSTHARLEALEEFSHHLKKARESWEKPAHKPVSRTSMKQGSVELF